MCKEKIDCQCQLRRRPGWCDPRHADILKQAGRFRRNWERSPSFDKYFPCFYIECKQQIQRNNVSQPAHFEHEQHLKVLKTDKQEI